MNLSIIYVFITAILFATYEPICKLVAADFAPLAISAIRFLISALILLPFSIYNMKKKNVRLTAGDHVKLAGLGVLFICISMTFLQYAIKFSSAPALIAILFSANSIFTIALSIVMLKEKLTSRKILALILSVAGILICSFDSLKVKGEAISILLALLSALTFSLYTVLNKKMMKKADGNVLVGFSFLYGGVILFIINLLLGGEIITTPTLSWNSILIMLYMGILVTGVGYWAYFKAMEKGSVMLASMAFFVKPALSPFVAFFVNGSPLTLQIFIALALVLAGSYFAAYAKDKK